MFYVITGPTASGKTSRAVALARATGGEIISTDSRQLYRGMDLGTGKDLEEYGDVPYHLIDIAPAGYRYNLHEYLRDFRAAFDDIMSRGKTVIVCGGTGLYVESVLNGIELPLVPRDEALRARLADKSLPELAALLSTMKTLRNNSDIDTPARALRAIEIATYYHEHPHLKALTAPHPVTDAVLVGVAIDRDTRRQRITQRLQARLDAGMLDEVRRLLDSGIDAAKVREIETAFDTCIERYSEANDGDFCDFDDRLAVEQVLNDMGLSFSFFDADYTITY